MNHMPIAIDLCICTFQRAHIALTLRSVAAMEMPENCSLRIIVADNDLEPSAQVLVASAASELGLPVTYIHAPHANISIARNACLNAATADYVAFIDDDELVSPHWLVAMVTAITTTNANVILGPVQALYPEDAPYWLSRGDFHSNRPAYDQGKIITGYSCNVLMHRTSPEQKALRFGEEFGVTGGEDTDYFARLYHLGATIDYAPDALIFEPTPPTRCTMNWLFARRSRMGETYATTHIKKYTQLHAIIASAKAMFSYAMIVPTLPWPAAWRFWLLRAVFHKSVAKTLFQRP